MRNLRGVCCWVIGMLAVCSGVAVAEPGRVGEKRDTRPAERTMPEFDPDAGTEAPLEGSPIEGSVAGSDLNCETVGAFTTTFQFAARYRGNLYRITEAGVFLKEIKQQLAIDSAVTANLYVSVHRRQPDNTFVEVDINLPSPSDGFRVVTYQGSGLNTPVLYSSGLLNGQNGIELPPGDYAIGFAWGSESIKYGRDTGVAYPRPIESGSTLGSVSRELSGTEPPVLATLPSLTLFTGGAYGQELCFVPTEGACCLSDGLDSRCENLLETECVGEGSFFHGQRTTCKDTICEFGACCFDCDAPGQNFVAKCRDNYVDLSCSLAGGINFWSGVSCPSDDALLCPKLVGACCNGTTCSLKCETECLAGGGTYEGDGTDCDPNTHVCKGACCITGGCLDRTQTGCQGLNGAFAGRGTRCFSESCGGACCYGLTSLEFCEQVAERELCVYDPEGFPVIAYKGDGTSCFNNEFEQDCGTIASYKACCLPHGECINTTQAVCTAPWIQGNFISTGTCATIAPNQCTNLLSRCCFTDGSCEVLTGNSCTARSGTPVVGQTTCGAGACNTTAGACCGTAAAACTMKTAAQCNAEGGIYQGDDSDCTNAAATCPGFGSCCRGNSECFDKKSSAQCATLGGAFGGPGTVCATQNCDQRGACCAVTGTCLQLTAGTCANNAGDFKGVGVQCASGVCPSGACCLPDGCKKRTPSACFTEGGDYQGDNTSCNTEDCITLGGCCRSGACTIETFEACFEGGTYLGDGTGCGENACVIGACCRIAGNCDPLVQQGSCEGPGDVFHATMDCMPGMCTPQGACCSGTPASCSVTTQATCTGTYLGDGVNCQFNSCAPTGACCSGSSCSQETSTDCTNAGGTYRGDETSCTPNPCTPPVTGACCNGTSCSEATQAFCQSSGGVYQGDGGDCEPNPCQTGSQCSGLVSSNPINCFNDGRRPHAPGNPAALQGIQSITMTFGADCTALPADFTVACSPTAAPCPTILTVTTVGATQTINFSTVIPAGNWTCVTHTASSAEVCVGSLPGDVDGNRTTAPVDIIKIIDNLNGQVLPPLTVERCDIDRSNICAPADIISLIDLLNGANGYIVWNGKNLPVCPSP